MEKTDYDSEGTDTDPELTLPYGYDVDMGSEPEDEEESDENKIGQTESDEPAKKPGSNLHCCWGLCTNDSRKFGKDSPISFLTFPKLGKIRKNMTVAQKNEAKAETEKCKRWAHLCGRKYFTYKSPTSPQG